MKTTFRLTRIQVDRKLKTVRTQYDGPGAFFITTISIIGSNSRDYVIMIPQAVAIALDEKCLGKLVKACSRLYENVIITKEEAPAEVVLEVRS
jgi:hypothetical protein